MKRRGWHWILMAVFVLVVAACDSGSDDTTTTTTGAATTTTAAATTTTAAATTTTAAATTTTADAGPKIITIGSTATATNLDAGDAYTIHDWELLHNTSESLLKFEQGTTNVIPGLAESYEVSDDGTTYTFNLRDGVKFGDGLDLTADIYKASIERMVEYHGSGGAGEALGVPFIESVEAPDPDTLVINLLGAFAFFPQVVTGTTYAPVHPDIFPADALNEFPDAPVYGAGPWIITSYTPDESTTLEPNPFYYGDPPNLDNVVIRYFSDEQTMSLALQAHEIDVAWRTTVDPAIIDTLAGVDGITVVPVPAGTNHQFFINHDDRFPTSDPNVQKAIALIVDRDGLSDAVFGGTVSPLYSQVPPGIFAAIEAFDTVYAGPDAAAAVALLAESGYSEDNKLELTVTFPPAHIGSATPDAMTVFADQLEATGVIEVTLEPIEWGTYIGGAIGGDEYYISYLNWAFDYPDPDNYLSPLVYNGGLGTRVTDPDTGEGINAELDRLVELLEQGALETDPVARAAIYEEAQLIYADQVVTLPLWFQPEYIAYWDDIVGDQGSVSPITLNVGPAFDLNYSILNRAG